MEMKRASIKLQYPETTGFFNSFRYKFQRLWRCVGGLTEDGEMAMEMWGSR